jgi:FtsH-binding integral membrane protein
MNQINTILDKKEYVRTYFVNAYGWMFLALAIMFGTSVGMAKIITQNPQIILYLYNTVSVFIIFIIQMILIFFLQAQGTKSIVNSEKGLPVNIGAAATSLLLFAFLEGIILTTILISVRISVINQAFLAATVTFGAAAIIGYYAKKDLSSAAKVALVSLIGIIMYQFISVILVFFGVNMYDGVLFGTIIPIGLIIIFSIFTAYDNQKMKEVAEISFNQNINTKVLSINHALSLFLNFVNIFITFIRLFSNRD